MRAFSFSPAAELLRARECFLFFQTRDDNDDDGAARFLPLFFFFFFAIFFFSLEEFVGFEANSAEDATRRRHFWCIEYSVLLLLLLGEDGKGGSGGGRDEGNGLRVRARRALLLLRRVSLASRRARRWLRLSA